MGGGPLRPGTGNYRPAALRKTRWPTQCDRAENATAGYKPDDNDGGGWAAEILGHP